MVYVRDPFGCSVDENLEWKQEVSQEASKVSD